MSQGTMVSEPARQTPVVAEADVCVLGGSCTGVFAAVAAARRGARVVLVELNGLLGGVATAGLVNVWHSLRDTERNETIIAGLTREVADRLDARGAAEVYEPPTSDRGFLLNTAELAIELDLLLAEHDVTCMLHTRFVDALAEDGRMIAAIVENKSGRSAIRAKCFIDATGDGDVVARMGWRRWRQEVLQPPTACCHVTGLDAWRAGRGERSIAAEVHHLEHPDALTEGFLWHAPVVGAGDMHMIAGTRAHNADCADAAQLTSAEVTTRRQIRAIVDILRRTAPEGVEVSLTAVPSCIGIRQSRQVICRYRLTEQDVLSGRRFSDAIANGSYRVDVHHSDRPGLTFRYLDGREEVLEPGRERQPGRWREPMGRDPTFYQIPLRCLIPAESRNVLVAGRMIDADEGAFGAVRVMVNCNQMGQSAGVAAAILADRGQCVDDLDAQAVRAGLSEQDAVVI